MYDVEKCTNGVQSSEMNVVRVFRPLIKVSGSLYTLQRESVTHYVDLAEYDMNARCRKNALMSCVL